MLVPVRDCRTAEGLRFYATPCVTGESLRDRVSREMQLPLEDALRLDRGGPPAGDYGAGLREGRTRWR